jgi:hypothetical protein
MSDPRDPGSDRATFLPVMFGAAVVLFSVTFLVMITGGLFFYVALVAGGLAAMGGLHYLLWGKLLSERTAGEREEAELLERAKAEEADPRGRYRT